jgi:hypothetical protein
VHKLGRIPNPGDLQEDRISAPHGVPVAGSSRIIAEAYDAEAETIYVRFPDGIEWWYSACPPHVWEEFTSPAQSRGQYIHAVLNHKPNARYAG